MQKFNFGQQGMMGGISPELLRKIQAEAGTPNAPLPLPGPGIPTPLPPVTNPDLYSDPNLGVPDPRDPVDVKTQPFNEGIGTLVAPPAPPVPPMGLGPKSEFDPNNPDLYSDPNLGVPKTKPGPATIIEDAEIYDTSIEGPDPLTAPRMFGPKPEFDPNSPDLYSDPELGVPKTKPGPAPIIEPEPAPAPIMEPQAGPKPGFDPNNPDLYSDPELGGPKTKEEPAPIIAPEPAPATIIEPEPAPAPPVPPMGLGPKPEFDPNNPDLYSDPDLGIGGSKIREVFDLGIDIDLPEDQEEVIYNPDGSIFVNAADDDEMYTEWDEIPTRQLNLMGGQQGGASPMPYRARYSSEEEFRKALIEYLLSNDVLVSGSNYDSDGNVVTEPDTVIDVVTDPVDPVSTTPDPIVEVEDPDPVEVKDPVEFEVEETDPFTNPEVVEVEVEDPDPVVEVEDPDPVVVEVEDPDPVVEVEDPDEIQIEINLDEYGSSDDYSSYTDFLTEMGAQNALVDTQTGEQNVYAEFSYDSETGNFVRDSSRFGIEGDDAFTSYTPEEFFSEFGRSVTSTKYDAYLDSIEAEEQRVADEAAAEEERLRLQAAEAEAERKRIEAEEAERKRLEAEQKRLAEEEAERKRLEAEDEAERIRLAEEAEKKRLEAEAEIERIRLEELTEKNRQARLRQAINTAQSSPFGQAISGNLSGGVLPDTGIVAPKGPTTDPFAREGGVAPQYGPLPGGNASDVLSGLGSNVYAPPPPRSYGQTDYEIDPDDPFRNPFLRGIGSINRDGGG